MSKIERVRRVCKWLVYMGYADNDKELAELLGYTKSSLSQILNEKVNLSDKFIDKLSKVDSNINKVWILKGVGKMLIKESEYSTKEPDENIQHLIDVQRKLIAKLENEIDELKKAKESPTRYNIAAEPDQ